MTPKPPSGLIRGGAGRRLWAAVTADFEPTSAGEAALLELAVRSADELGRLEAELTGATTLVAGSTGQVRPHPLFGEVRAARAALARLLLQLGVVEAGEDETADADRAYHGRALAAARWRNVRGA